MTLRTSLSAAAFFAIGLAVARADDGALRDLCADRPGKGTSACTVDAGHFQIETELFNGAFQHEDGLNIDTYVFPNPTFKYGVTDAWDIEANLVPFVEIHLHDSATDATQTMSGVGDLYLRSKWTVIGNGGSDFALAVESFVKLPTASEVIGNGAVEGGVLVPLSLNLGNNWSLGATPEIDVLKNGTDAGRHAELTGVAGISRGFDCGVTLGAELWQSRDFDPSGATQQASFDLSAAWIPSGDKNLQLDGGVNFGLTRATSDTQIYAGISRRF